MIAKVVHVIGLQPRQQGALSLILLNFLMMFAQKMFNDIEDDMSISTVESKKTSMLKAIENFYSLIDVLSTSKNYVRAKPKLVALSPTGMKNISTAIEAMMPTENFLERSEVELVMSEYKNLERVVKESLKHTYTEEEIKKAGVK